MAEYIKRTDAVKIAKKVRACERLCIGTAYRTGGLHCKRYFGVARRRRCGGCAWAVDCVTR